MRIAIDIDGTITESADKIEFPLCEKWLTTKGIKYNRRDYSQPNVKNAFNLSEKIFRSWLDEYFPHNVRNAILRPNVVESLRILQRHRHELLFVTRRDPNYNGKYKGKEMVDDTYEWFHNNHVPYDTIYFGAKDKLKVCTEIGAQIMIDDEPINIIPLAKAGFPCIVIKTQYNFPPKDNSLLDTPYIIYKDEWVGIRDFLLRLGSIVD